ncbi:MAG: hypothetical protein ABJ311_10550 [Erythrobacter sp.]
MWIGAATLIKLVAAILMVYSYGASACSPPTPYPETATIFSPVQSKQVPNGAIQLRVAVSSGLEHNNGYLTLKVMGVVDGDFTKKTIRLNVANSSGCNVELIGMRELFDGAAGYVTVLPMRYEDGQPITNSLGTLEYGALQYRGYKWLPKADDYEILRLEGFAERQHLEFQNESKSGCLSEADSDREFQDIHENGFSEQAWRKCVEPGESVALECQNDNSGALICEEDEWLKGRPADLQRGFNPWIHNGPTIIFGVVVGSLLAGIVGFFWRRRRRS